MSGNMPYSVTNYYLADFTFFLVAIVTSHLVLSIHKGLSIYYVISKLTYMVIYITTEHDAVYHYGVLDSLRLYVLFTSINLLSTFNLINSHFSSFCPRPFSSNYRRRVPTDSAFLELFLVSIINLMNPNY